MLEEVAYDEMADAFDAEEAMPDKPDTVRRMRLSLLCLYIYIYVRLRLRIHKLRRNLN